MRRAIVSGLIGSVLTCASAAAATQTGSTGNGLPFSNVQPSLGLNYMVRVQGDLNLLGEVSLFAGSSAPSGWALANGQLLSKSQNQALFDAIGTTYGGSQSAFALPDLRGRTVVGSGTGAGLTARAVGQTFGTPTVTLTEQQMPAHAHVLLDAPGITEQTGGSTPFSNVQPSLVLNYGFVRTGNFPLPTGSIAPPMTGQVRAFAGALPAAANVQAADGTLLGVSTNTGLNAVYGTSFGGNGITNFAVPDLRGRTVAGTGSGVERQLVIGERPGAELTTLTVGQLPVHSHTVPGSITPAGFTGGSGPVENDQPSLALTYLIATDGQSSPVGEIVLFGGNYAPGGWARCEGQLLSISNNPELYGVLGTTYGGNGVSTFALPDLRGRSAIGAGTGQGLDAVVLGDAYGADDITLFSANLPSHVHAIAPEPATLAALTALSGATLRRRRRVV